MGLLSLRFFWDEFVNDFFHRGSVLAFLGEQVKDEIIELFRVNLWKRLGIIMDYVVP